MKLHVLLLLALLFSVSSYAQCEWDGQVCITGCGDVWDGGGQTLVCFDPGETSPTHPAEIPFCWSSLRELFVDREHPTDGTIFTGRRSSLFLLCQPDDVCSGSFELYRVGIDPNTGEENGADLIDSDPSIFTGTDRGTFCNECPNGGNSYITLPHGNILTALGTYRMELVYTCCDENGNVIGTSSTSFYYEFVPTASDVDVEIAFTASQQIETINGDTNIDGIITTDGSSPGPALGPASAGVRVSAVGNGVIDYTVELYEVDCNDNAIEILINTETIPYNGDQEIFYSFLNIPNWENIYDPTACYKVVTKVNSFCGQYEEEAFFTITNLCTFCFIIGGSNTGQDDEGEDMDQEPTVTLDAGDQFMIQTDVPLREVYVLDQWGRILQKYQNITPSSNSMAFDQFTTGGQYYLIVSITDDGYVTKTMLPRQR